MLYGNTLLMLVYLIPTALLSLSFHELAHAFVSYRLGDPTAKNLGRLTLNPLKHLDPLGTLMIIISSLQGRGFGWAKPVPINPAYYRDRRKGTMLVSLAGPLSNILLAFISFIPVAYLEGKYGNQVVLSTGLIPILYNFSILFYRINIGLAVFNIIPVPPLDGSKILSGILPPRQYFKLMEYENYIGIVFLLVIFMLPGVLYKVMSPFIFVIETAISFIVNPIVNMLL